MAIRRDRYSRRYAHAGIQVDHRGAGGRGLDQVGQPDGREASTLAQYRRGIEPPNGGIKIRCLSSVTF
jgi:hypothetical protein